MYVLFQLHYIKLYLLTSKSPNSTKELLYVCLYFVINDIIDKKVFGMYSDDVNKYLTNLMRFFFYFFHFSHAENYFFKTKQLLCLISYNMNYNKMYKIY